MFWSYRLVRIYNSITIVSVVASGKTWFALNLILRRDELIHPNVDTVHVVYGSSNEAQYQHLLADDKITLSQADPETIVKEVYNTPGNKLLFIDGTHTN